MSDICTATAPNVVTLPCGIPFQREQGMLCTNPALNQCNHRRDSALVENIKSAGQAVLSEPKNRRIHHALTHHTNTRGEKLDFQDKHYLIALYQDWSPEITVMKAAQVGVSEFEVVSIFEGAIERREASLMIFPTEVDHRDRFVDDRIDPPIARSPFYRAQMRMEGMKEKDKKSLKWFGGTFLYFQGSNKEFTSVSVETLVYDDFDFLNQDHLPSAESRQGFIPFGARRSIKGSTPSSTDERIHAEYLQTDQKSYLIKCSSCNQWQAHDFFTHIVQQIADDKYQLLDQEWTPDHERDIYVFCGKCQRPMPRVIDGGDWWKHQHAEWVPKKPSIKGKSGYHISKMISPYTRLRDLWKKLTEKCLYSEAEMKTLYNYDLGLPYTLKGGGVSESLLQELSQLQPYRMPDMCVGDVIAGIDVQDQSVRVVAAEVMEGDIPLRVVYVGPLLWDQIAPILIGRYHCQAYVMDFRPEAQKARELRDKMQKTHHCQAWLCWYATHEMKDAAWEEDASTWKIKADRTQTMDETFKWLNLKKLAIPADYKDLPRYAERERDKFAFQVMKPKRVSAKRKNSKGAEIDVVDWEGKPDDYYQAINYLRMCYEIVHPSGKGLWGVTVSRKEDQKKREERRIITSKYGGLMFPH